MGWNGNGYTFTKNKGLQVKGIKGTVNITMYDSRTLKCTLDHRILIKTNKSIEWVEAGNLKSGDQIVSGIEYPQDIICENEEKWSLQLGDFMFNMSNAREKTKAFCRILGYVLTDGSITNGNVKKSSVILGTLIDVKEMLSDIYILTNKKPSVDDKVGDKGLNSDDSGGD